MSFKPWQKVLFITLAAMLFAALALYVVRQAVDLSRDLSEHLTWMLPAGLVVLALAGVLVWTFSRKPLEKTAKPIDRQTVEDDIVRAENMGIDVTELRRALEEMERRRKGQVLSLAVFGSVNTGKSSLVQALTGNADIRKSPASGTTGEVGRYEWTQFGGYRVRLSDVPGRFEYDNPQRAEDAWNEAMGADLIVYVTDADLTREQVEDVEKLAQSGKPLVVTLNKVDLYDEEEIGLILASIRARLVGVPGEPAVAAVHSGGKRKVVTQDAEGRERESWRDIPPDLSELSAHAASLLSHDPERLIGLADTVFIGHLHRRVREAVEERRRELAFGVINEYSRAAVIASMAAVVPGIEVVLLSGIGVKMVSKINDLYGSPLSGGRIEVLLRATVEQFSDVGKLSLVIGGNVLKAFPGIGTVAGGVLHAVVYGLVTRGVGRTLQQTLAERETFSEDAFFAQLRQNIERLPSKEDFVKLLHIARNSPRDEAPDRIDPS